MARLKFGEQLGYGTELLVFLRIAGDGLVAAVLRKLEPCFLIYGVVRARRGMAGGEGSGVGDGRCARLKLERRPLDRKIGQNVRVLHGDGIYVADHKEAVHQHEVGGFQRHVLSVEAKLHILKVCGQRFAVQDKADLVGIGLSGLEGIEIFAGSLGKTVEKLRVVMGLSVLGNPALVVQRIALAGGDAAGKDRSLTGDGGQGRGQLKAVEFPGRAARNGDGDEEEAGKALTGGGGKHLAGRDGLAVD